MHLTKMPILCYFKNKISYMLFTGRSYLCKSTTKTHHKRNTVYYDYEKIDIVFWRITVLDTLRSCWQQAGCTYGKRQV